MKKTVFFFWVLLFLPLSSWAEQTLRYYRDVNLYPLQEKEDIKLVQKMMVKGFSEAEILDSVQKKYFYEVPVLTNEVKEYQYGAVMVTDDGTNSLIEEPVTGFTIRLEFIPDQKERKIKKKTILHFGEEVDRVDYTYLNGKLSSAHSNLFGSRYFSH